MTASASVRDVLDALAAHRLKVGLGGVLVVCVCGEEFVSMAGHRAHLADVLAPLLEEAAADGWDEGHAAGWFDARDLRDETPNPHRARREAAPPSPDAECCASGRCEVCSPGYVWGRDR